MRGVCRVLAGAAVLQAVVLGSARAAPDEARAPGEPAPAAATATAAAIAHGPQAGLVDRLVDTLADAFVPAQPALEGDAAARRRELHAAVRQQLQGPVLALVNSEAADRMRDPRAEAVAARVLERVQALRRTAPLRWPASVREERFRRAFSESDAQGACAAPRGAPAELPPLPFITASVDALFSTAPALRPPQPELSLRLVDAVIEAMQQPGRVEPPFPEQAVSALGVGLGTAGDEGSRRALCVVSFWWAQRALAKPLADRQQDIDAYVHASVVGAPQAWRPLPDGLGQGAGWLVGTAPAR